MENGVEEWVASGWPCTYCVHNTRRYCKSLWELNSRVYCTIKKEQCAHLSLSLLLSSSLTLSVAFVSFPWISFVSTCNFLMNHCVLCVLSLNQVEAQQTLSTPRESSARIRKRRTERPPPPRSGQRRPLLNTR